MKTIIVGSKNKAKLKAVTDAAACYWADAAVEGREVPSGVPDQPLGLEQTTEGAVNRAKAVHALGGCDLGVGLEGGVMELAGRPVLFGVVAVYDGARASAVTTCGVPLPDSWGEALRNGEELGPFVVRIFKDYNKTIGAAPFLTNNVVMRDDVFREAVKGALAPWVNTAAFAEPLADAA